IVHVIDVDTAEDESFFLIMEYIRGQNLEQFLKHEGRLRVETAIHIASQVCSALDFAHTQGIVHRDVKPTNIMLANTAGGEQVKLMDFGIAKATLGASDAFGRTMTKTGWFIGSPKYSSPEQALGRTTAQIDGRSDIYSLGVVLYEMLSGQSPFTADTPMGLLIEH